MPRTSKRKAQQRVGMEQGDIFKSLDTRTDID